MHHNDERTVIRKVMRFPALSFEMSYNDEPNRENKLIRYVNFDFKYNGLNSYVTARYEVNSKVYEDVTMNAGFVRPAGINNYEELGELMDHLRGMFRI